MKKCKRCGIELLESFYTDGEDYCVTCNSIVNDEKQLEDMIKDGAPEEEIESLRKYIEETKRKWDNMTI